MDHRRRDTADIQWTPWVADDTPGFRSPRTSTTRVRLQILRMLLALGTAALLFIVIRAAVLYGYFSLTDTANAALFGLLLVLAFVWPRWVTAIAWLGLVALFINAIDGLNFHSGTAVTPSHLLFPLFILYAALLGDFFMTAFAMLGVIGIYTATWVVRDSITGNDTVMLTNLIALAVISGVAALGVWARHSRLQKRLDRQAQLLRTELETRLKLQAMVTHDIRTPLTALLNAALLDDPEVVQEMASRIANITDSARELTKGSGIRVSVVKMAEIWRYMEEMFSANILEKGQRLETRGDPDVYVEADLAILCSSVIGNFVTNASKFSPRDSTITITSDLVGDSVRIAVLDEGPGLPEDQVLNGPDSPSRRSAKGTEGEQGSGYGLQIATLCAARMDGGVEVGSGAGGGAISVLLPRAHRSQPA